MSVIGSYCGLIQNVLYASLYAISIAGSHCGLIQNVLDSRADVAAVDCNALHGFLRQHPNHADDITVINSFGPLPTYPIVFNSKMPGESRVYCEIINICCTFNFMYFVDRTIQEFKIPRKN